MNGWLGWQRFVGYRLMRRNRRTLVSILAVLENDAVINKVFQELTIKQLGAIHLIVQEIRDRKVAEDLARADEKMAGISSSRPAHAWSTASRPAVDRRTDKDVGEEESNPPAA